jgi:chlorinating enzyme
MLSKSQITSFDQDGFLSPINVLDTEEVNLLRSKLEVTEAKQNGSLYPEQRNKSFLLFKWLNELVRDDRILDPISQLIGPNILLWNTLFWIKEAKAKTFVSWHQDTKYWGLSSQKVVTAWIALSPANKNSGCMRVMPKTHTGEVLAHQDRYHKNNLLTRGQEIKKTIDETRAVYMPLRPGQMSIHNYRLAHASGPNLSKERRIGVSMHFMPPDTKQIVGDWDCAMLVKGKDDFKNFAKTPIPICDFDPEAVAFHKKAAYETNQVLYDGAKINDGKL